jgi:hypothetical protein
MVDPHLRNRLLFAYTAALFGFWAVGEARLWWFRTKMRAHAATPWDVQAILGWSPASSAPLHRERARR